MLGLRQGSDLLRSAVYVIPLDNREYDLSPYTDSLDDSSPYENAVMAKNMANRGLKKILLDFKLMSSISPLI